MDFLKYYCIPTKELNYTKRYYKVSLLCICLYIYYKMSLQRYELNFLNSIRSEATRKYYRYYFSKYSEFVKGNLLGDTRIIESQVIDFLLSLKNKHLTFDSIKCYFAAITHFYIMNDVILNRKKIIEFIDTDERKKHKNTGYTTEQIHKLLDICDERL